ncbi:MAG: T9SS type A sorting domain-containing protein [Crocinitomicaceae bacterium]
MRNVMIFTALFSCLFASAQVFEMPISNPFGFKTDSLILDFHFTSFADLDGDMDYDVLISDFDGFFHYFENIGDKNTPLYENSIRNPFGISRVNYPDCSCNNMVHRFVDLDEDGDKDIIAIAWYGAEYWYAENIGDVKNPSFAEFKNDLDWMPKSFTYGPYPGMDLVDIDNDGDLDIFTCQGDVLNLIENKGSKNFPDFSSELIENPFNIILSGRHLFPSFVDLDLDGDFDLFVGGNRYPKQDFQYYENVGSSDNPIFAPVQENPFELVNSSITFPSLTFVDIDGDNDQDLFLGGKLDEEDMVFDFYQNISESTSISEGASLDIRIYPNPTNGFLNVDLNSLNDLDHINVYDIFGQLKSVTKPDSEFNLSIDLRDFENGLYLIELVSQQEKHILHVVKK